MINNYYTLKALTDEIRDDVESSEIEACYTRVENTLEIILGKPGGKSKVLVISCKPKANHLFLQEAPRRHTGANVLHSAVGGTVLSIEAVRNERMVLLRLSDGRSLAINLFGPHANVYLISGPGEIADSFFRKKKPSVNTPIESPAATDDEGSSQRFVGHFKEAEGSPLQRLAALVPPFGGNLGKETFYRAGGDDLMGIARDRSALLDEVTVSMLYETVSRMRRELSEPDPRIYYDGDDPVMMSLIEMRHLGRLREESFASVNACIIAYSTGAEKHNSDAELKSGVLGRLMKKRDEFRETIRKIENDISGNRESKYRSTGDLIMQHLGEIEKGAGTFHVNDGDLEIRLDPKLTTIQNAQAYYEKAKKARESYRQSVDRKKQLTSSLETVIAELKKVGAGTDRFKLLSMAKADYEKEEALPPFRVFETNDYKIFVGKDSKNNDELTFGFAKPNDVFLHARGVSGSHVIVRNSSREYPQKAVLEFAARIAAHYSKARTSSIVPVAYTMRKFVKKVRGRPGAVILDREEVIFVKPGIPQPSR